MDRHSELTQQEMLTAIWDRAAAYDGLFFICVRTTGIYCYPSCPSRRPKPESVLLVGSRAQAIELGFRPCKRCHSDLDGGKAKYEQEVADRALALIDQHLASITTAGLAAGVGFSSSHLSRIFRRRTGQSLDEHIRNRRVELAAEILQASSQPILEIAATVGYQSSSALYVAFHQRFGVAPGQYRRAHLLTIGGAKA